MTKSADVAAKIRAEVGKGVPYKTVAEICGVSTGFISHTISKMTVAEKRINSTNLSTVKIASRKDHSVDKSEPEIVTHTTKDLGTLVGAQRHYGYQTASRDCILSFKKSDKDAIRESSCDRHWWEHRERVTLL